MTTIRFPSGLCVRYNSAAAFSRINGGTHLERKDRPNRTLAFIPDASGAIVEWTPPCAVFNTNESDALKDIQRELVALRRKISVSQSKRRKPTKKKGQ